MLRASGSGPGGDRRGLNASPPAVGPSGLVVGGWRRAGAQGPLGRHASGAPRESVDGWPLATVSTKTLGGALQPIPVPRGVIR